MFQIQHKYNEGWGIFRAPSRTVEFLTLEGARSSFGGCCGGDSLWRILDLETLEVHPVVVKQEFYVVRKLHFGFTRFSGIAADYISDVFPSFASCLSDLMQRKTNNDIHLGAGNWPTDYLIGEFPGGKLHPIPAGAGDRGRRGGIFDRRAVLMGRYLVRRREEERRHDTATRAKFREIESLKARIKTLEKA